MFNWMPGNQPGFLKASSHRNASPVALILCLPKKNTTGLTCEATITHNSILTL